MNKSIYSKLAEHNCVLDNVGTIIHAGAGSCIELIWYQSLQPDQVVLLEANPQLFQSLEKKTSSKDNLTLIQGALVNADSESEAKPEDEVDKNCINFYLTQPAQFSGVLPPGHFKKIFKNLAVTSVEPVVTMTLDQLLNDCDLAEQKQHLLVLQLNGSEGDIVNDSNQHLLNKFDVVIVQRINDDLLSEYHSKVTDALYEANFNLAIEDGYDLVFSNCVYIKDIKQQRINELEVMLSASGSENNALKVSLTQAKQAAEAIKTDLEAENAELTIRNSELAALNSQLEIDLTELNQQRDEDRHNALEVKVSELLKTIDLKDTLLLEKKGELESSKALLAQKEQQLTKAIDMFSGEIDTDTLEQIAEKITKSHKKELAELKKSLGWRIDKGVNNSIKQVESFMGVNSFLETGNLTMEYHGWPISSDIALYLLGKVKANNYDLIIEFGSGTSTQLFAKAVQYLTTNNIESTSSAAKLIQDTAVSHSDRKEMVECIHDIPQRVLTFEHNKKYYEKTLEGLRQSRLESIVNLVHTPLVDCTVDGDDYLYYSCDKSLAHIADIFEGRMAKILVLVDGPPGTTGPLARMPAMSKLLNTLGMHQLDVILDDYNREEEKEIATKWKRMLEARFINFEEELVPCEKGAFVCRINP